MNDPKSVAGVIFSPDRRSILLIKRRDVPIWVLPGGGIDPGETSEHAMIREILEETGFTVKADRLVGDYLPINRLSKHTHLYECKVLSGKETLSEETNGVAFFPLTKLPLMPPPYPEWIQDTILQLPPQRKLMTSVNYFTLFKNLILHPVLVLRFLSARLGLAINTKE